MKRVHYEESEATARQYVRTYKRKCAAAAQFIRSTLAKALDKKQIKCHSSTRAKDEQSFAIKLRKERKESLPLKSLIPFVGTEEDENRIKDLAGAGVSLYFPSDWAMVEAQVFKHFKNVTIKDHSEPDRKRP